MNPVVEYYENYKEENRLSTNKARKIEFITTIHMIDSVIEKNSIVLDCAAGTGIYAFYLAEKGHKVTATDITPRHIEYIRDQLKDKPYDMDTDVLDACDMSRRDLTIMTATEKGIRKLGVEHFDTGTLKREKTEMFIELYKAGLVKDMSHMGLWKVSFTLREF